MHHELTHTLFSHLTAIFGNHNPIAIEPPVERSHPVEPLREDSHPKLDSTDSACTTNMVEPTITDINGKAVLDGEPVERAYRVELESCEGVEPMDGPNKSEEPDDGSIPCVCLGDASWHACDPNGRRSRTDGSSGQTDRSRESTDTSDALNQAEMPGISRGNDVSTYLDPGDAKHRINKMGGVGSHTDTSNRLMDIPSVERDVNRPANAPDSVRIPQKKAKPPDLPSQHAKWHSDELKGCGNHLDMLTVYTDTSCIGNDMGTAENEMKNVKTC